jgi:hypothetical protein
MTSSSLLACSTGKSAGLAPLQDTACVHADLTKGDSKNMINIE